MMVVLNRKRAVSFTTVVAVALAVSAAAWACTGWNGTIGTSGTLAITDNANKVDGHATHVHTVSAGRTGDTLTFTGAFPIFLGASPLPPTVSNVTAAANDLKPMPTGQSVTLGALVTHPVPIVGSTDTMPCMNYTTIATTPNVPTTGTGGSFTMTAAVPTAPPALAGTGSLLVWFCAYWDARDFSTNPVPFLVVNP